MARQVPRPFQYAWASGQIVEEVSAPNPHCEPVTQLLRSEGGAHCSAALFSVKPDAFAASPAYGVHGGDGNHAGKEQARLVRTDRIVAGGRSRASFDFWRQASAR